MCGIVGAVAERDVSAILLEGLKRLEYRGYDSAGIALINATQTIDRLRKRGKVAELAQAMQTHPVQGHTGIAHTRWATHGEPSQRNAHPHMSGDDLAIVHNGIIENHAQLRRDLQSQGYTFHSETDTEIIAHLLHHHLEQAGDLLAALQIVVTLLEGAFALGVIHQNEPDRLVAARRGSPLILGVGEQENFIASDILALLPVTQRFIHLEEGDFADLRRDQITLYDLNKTPVERKIIVTQLQHQVTERGHYRHFMQKEIFEQTLAMQATLEGRLGTGRVLEGCFGTQATAIFDQVERVHIAACGTSFHAAMVARYWLEGLAGVPCKVDLASEFRYRKTVVQPNTLFLTISQSGETADTLAALRLAKQEAFLANLAICNVPESSLVREADLVFMTRAGVEIGVASTKAFTTQLTALLLLTAVLGRRHTLEPKTEAALVKALRDLPKDIEAFLALDQKIKDLAEQFADKAHTLFLGRGAMYPIAMEGALKLKELSYIHAEAYPGGELKHGPLALVDHTMPVVAVAPNDAVFEKLHSNLAEVHARGGELILFSNGDFSDFTEHTTCIPVPDVSDYTAPILYTLPLQLLAYHVAVCKGTDVDQPRNLAKSVTVE